MDKLKKALPYLGYYSLATIVVIAFLSQIWIGVLVLDEPELINSNYLIGMVTSSVIILGAMVFLATRKKGYALGLTALSLFLCFVTSDLLFNLPSVSEWQGVDILQILLVVTCFLSVAINGTKITIKMIFKKGYA